MKKLYACLFAMLLTLACTSNVGRAENGDNMFGNNNDNNVTTTAADDNDMDWGWLGLLGLAGLAGVRGRDRNPQR